MKAIDEEVRALEEQVRGQFAKVFGVADWALFREMAEIFFSEAAFLKARSFQVPENRRLLVRNSRKRLLIGIAAELIVKAIYLRAGFCINKLPRKYKGDLRLPFTATEAQGTALQAADTYTLDPLVSKLERVVVLQDPESVLKGLAIARIFRNKEGHVVTDGHRFDASNYRAIETALTALYESAFGERLHVRFSLEPDEEGRWHVDGSGRGHRPG
jgi:hypothetical protein